MSDPLLYKFNKSTLDELLGAPGHRHLQRTFEDTVISCVPTQAWNSVIFTIWAVPLEPNNANAQA